MPLTNVAIQSAKPREKAYKLADGQGMYLEVTPSGSKYSRLKYRIDGKEKRMALGVSQRLLCCRPQGSRRDQRAVARWA
jgi:Arm DNA-binding domain